jgi:prepilin-type processing-associated H-X9-DG protein
MFAINDGRSMSEVSVDGTSNTFVIGESSMKQYNGYIDGGGRVQSSNRASPPQAGWASWWSGGGAGSNVDGLGLKAKRKLLTNPARHVLTLNAPINDPRFLPGGTLYFTASKYYDTPFTSFHTGGANFVFGDGHTQFVSDSGDILACREACSINSGGVLDHDSL